MSQSPGEYIAKKEIKEISQLKKTTLTNALAALKKRQIILAHREKPGLYKLPTASFAVWIRARARREQEKRGSKL